MELELIRLEELHISELTKIIPLKSYILLHQMERAFDEDTRIHLCEDKDGPDGYDVVVF